MAAEARLTSDGEPPSLWASSVTLMHQLHAMLGENLEYAQDPTISGTGEPDRDTSRLLLADLTDCSSLLCRHNEMFMAAAAHSPDLGTPPPLLHPSLANPATPSHLHHRVSYLQAELETVGDALLCSDTLLTRVEERVTLLTSEGHDAYDMLSQADTALQRLEAMLADATPPSPEQGAAQPPPSPQLASASEAADVVRVLKERVTELSDEVEARHQVARRLLREKRELADERDSAFACLEEANASLETLHATLAGDCAAWDAVEVENSQLRTCLDTTQSRLREAEALNASSSRAATRVEELEAEVQDLQGTVRSAEADAEEVAALQAELGKLQSIPEKVVGLQQQVELLQAEVVRAEEACRQSTDELESVRLQLREAEGVRDEMEAEQAEQVEAAEAAAASASHDVSALRAELQAVASQLEEGASQSTQLEEAHLRAVLQAEAGDVFVSTLHAALQQVWVLGAEVGGGGSQGDLETAEDLQSLVEQLEAKVAELQEGKRGGEDAAAEAERLEALLGEPEGRCAELQARIGELEAAATGRVGWEPCDAACQASESPAGDPAAGLPDESDAEQQKHSETLHQLEQLREELAEAEGRCEALQHRVDDMVETGAAGGAVPTTRAPGEEGEGVSDTASEPHGGDARCGDEAGKQEQHSEGLQQLDHLQDHLEAAEGRCAMLQARVDELEASAAQQQPGSDAPARGAGICESCAVECQTSEPPSEMSDEATEQPSGAPEAAEGSEEQMGQQVAQLRDALAAAEGRCASLQGRVGELESSQNPGGAAGGEQPTSDAAAQHEACGMCDTACQTHGGAQEGAESSPDAGVPEEGGAEEQQAEGLQQMGQLQEHLAEAEGRCAELQARVEELEAGGGAPPPAPPARELLESCAVGCQTSQPPSEESHLDVSDDAQQTQQTHAESLDKLREALALSESRCAELESRPSPDTAGAPSSTPTPCEDAACQTSEAPAEMLPQTDAEADADAEVESGPDAEEEHLRQEALTAAEGRCAGLQRRVDELEALSQAQPGGVPSDVQQGGSLEVVTSGMQTEELEAGGNLEGALQELQAHVAVLEKQHEADTRHASQLVDDCEEVSKQLRILQAENEELSASFHTVQHQQDQAQPALQPQPSDDATLCSPLSPLSPCGVQAATQTDLPAEAALQDTATEDPIAAALQQQQAAVEVAAQRLAAAQGAAEEHGAVVQQLEAEKAAALSSAAELEAQLQEKTDSLAGAMQRLEAAHPQAGRVDLGVQTDAVPVEEDLTKEDNASVASSRAASSAAKAEKGKGSDVGGAAAEYAALKEKCSALEADVAGLREANKALEGRVEASGGAEGRCQELERDLAAARKKQRQLSDRLQRAQRPPDSTSSTPSMQAPGFDLHHEVRRLQQENRALLQRQLAGTASDSEALSAPTPTMESAARSDARLGVEMARLRAENKTLTQKLLHLRQHVRQLTVEAASTVAPSEVSHDPASIATPATSVRSPVRRSSTRTRDRVQSSRATTAAPSLAKHSPARGVRGVVESSAASAVSQSTEETHGAREENAVLRERLRALLAKDLEVEEHRKRCAALQAEVASLGDELRRHKAREMEAEAVGSPHRAQHGMRALKRQNALLERELQPLREQHRAMAFFLRAAHHTSTLRRSFSIWVSHVHARELQNAQHASRGFARHQLLLEQRMQAEVCRVQGRLRCGMLLWRYFHKWGRAQQARSSAVLHTSPHHAPSALSLRQRRGVVLKTFSACHSGLQRGWVRVWWVRWLCHTVAAVAVRTTQAPRGAPHPAQASIESAAAAAVSAAAERWGIDPASLQQRSSQLEADLLQARLRAGELEGELHRERSRSRSRSQSRSRTRSASPSHERLGHMATLLQQVAAELGDEAPASPESPTAHTGHYSQPRSCARRKCGVTPSHPRGSLPVHSLQPTGSSGNINGGPSFRAPARVAVAPTYGTASPKWAR